MTTAAQAWVQFEHEWGHVWVWRLPALEGAAACLPPIQLPEATLRRAAQFANASLRTEYLASHAQFHRSLKAFGVADSCASWQTDRHGKPFILGAPPFNVSRRPRHAAMILGRAGQPAVGIDLELISNASIARSTCDEILSDQERQAFAEAGGHRLADRRLITLWTRKEAVLKALGSGLTVSPSSFDVGFGNERTVTTLSLPFETNASRVLVESHQFDGVALSIARLDALTPSAS